VTGLIVYPICVCSYWKK